MLEERIEKCEEQRRIRRSGGKKEKLQQIKKSFQKDEKKQKKSFQFKGKALFKKKALMCSMLEALMTDSRSSSSSSRSNLASLACWTAIPKLKI